jgi:ribosomal protein S18 acetylase RimI-like enzyme
MHEPSATVLKHCSADDLEHHLDDFGGLLHACVHDGANIGFVLPFDVPDSLAFWRHAVLPDLRQGTRRLVSVWDGAILAGAVQLAPATMPNQTHRADVSKLLVHPDFRRRGLARVLMAELEGLALDQGFTLLTLDTTTGSSAEPLYTSLGFETAGVIPNYCRDPIADRIDPTTLMFKILK